jgi:hypothetical protein
LKEVSARGERQQFFVIVVLRDISEGIVSTPKMNSGVRGARRCCFLEVDGTLPNGLATLVGNMIQWRL